ncbi:MAG: Crp/Fnr family transcriptional regulator [Desulfobulbaceae bacterium]|nr:Crp/Fnr family transcriptional regulator [Desulfobulbaceae bacterium]HIJ78365.1 Crp/Fnr family transcriptional regulator [Deltaproteobacteria bacterium]
MEFMDFLSTVSLFSGLTREQYDELAMIVTMQEYKRGQPIFAEGDEGNGFYLVMEGLVKIYKLSMDGKEQILHIFGPGEPFAEAAVFTGSRFPAHALALEKSRIIFVPRASFIKMIEANPSLAMNMLAALSMRLKKFTHMIEDLSLKEVPGRLAAHILYLSEQQEDRESVRLNIGKAQLASLLGTIPETLSRILTKLSKQGLLNIDGPVITILDRDGLEELSAGETRLK